MNVNIYISTVTMDSKVYDNRTRISVTGEEKV